MYMARSQSFEEYHYAMNPQPDVISSLSALSALFSNILRLCPYITKGDQVSNPHKPT